MDEQINKFKKSFNKNTQRTLSATVIVPYGHLFFAKFQRNTKFVVYHQLVFCVEMLVEI